MRIGGLRSERGVGLIEVMISIVISMLLVLVIYQIYEISEGQKRTITAGSDAQQNASYGLFVLGRDLAIAGNGIASLTSSMDLCANTKLRPIPVVIEAGATASDPDTITVFYGGSSSLSTPVPLQGSHAVGDAMFVVRAPVGFSAKDVIAAAQGNNCTLSTVDVGGVAVDGNGMATITRTLVLGEVDQNYSAVSASLVNLGKKESMGRIAYSVDPTTHALRTQRELPAVEPVTPLVSDVVNLKAQYGLDTNQDGIIDTWQDATGAVWLAANLPNQPPATWKQIRAVRVAIVTRSAQYEKDPITAGSPPGMPAGKLGIFCDPAPTCAATMTLSADEQHYRYKILETIVPLRNALWNPT